MSAFDSQTSNYDSGTTSDSSSSSSKTNKEFAKSIKGIFRIVESGVSLIAFICVAVAKDGKHGEDNGAAAGWCMFVAMFSCLVFVTTYFLWLFQVFPNPKVPWKFIEFDLFVAFATLYFISGCVAAVKGDTHGGMAAGSFFHFSMMVVCGVDAFFHYQYWRQSDEGPYICGQSLGGAPSGDSGNTTSTPSTEARGPTY